MAKNILWLTVILVFVSFLIAYFNGDDIGVSPRIIMFSALGVLAICESIEKTKS